MSEPFDFTGHLREIAAPALSAHGFRQRGAFFVRDQSGVQAEIWFQRDYYNSLYSSRGEACRFFLNLHCGRSSEE